MEFQQAQGNLLCSGKNAFGGGSKLGKNDTYDADTLMWTASWFNVAVSK